MASRAIICIGNRHVPGDDIGPRVFEALSTLDLPRDVELIDGGLCGLDLLRCLEGRRRVVFADALAGIAAPGNVVTLDADEVAALATGYGHDAGLPYLLAALPHAALGTAPEILLVGTDGEAGTDTIRRAARRCVELVSDGAA